MSQGEIKILRDLGTLFITDSLTTKGQVTIPKEIRELLHLHSGNKIDFIIKENGEAVIRPISKKVDDVFCKLKNAKKKPVSVEEIKLAIQNRFKQKYHERN